MDCPELDLGNLETIKLESQQRLRVLARVRVDPAAIENTQHSFEFVITPQAGLNTDPVRRPALFYMQK